jgi:nucleoside-diphosphate-sugar epimerase
MAEVTYLVTRTSGLIGMSVMHRLLSQGGAQVVASDILADPSSRLGELDPVDHACCDVLATSPCWSHQVAPARYDGSPRRDAGSGLRCPSEGGIQANAMGTDHVLAPSRILTAALRDSSLRSMRASLVLSTSPAFSPLKNRSPIFAGTHQYTIRPL